MYIRFSVLALPDRVDSVLSRTSIHCSRYWFIDNNFESLLTFLYHILISNTDFVLFYFIFEKSRLCVINKILYINQSSVFFFAIFHFIIQISILYSLRC